MTLRKLDEEHRGRDKDADEAVLFHLLYRGVVDHREVDKPWDGSVRSIRFASAVGDRLWAMLEKERERVSLPLPAISRVRANNFF